jgi:hypothetical protein
VSGESLQLLGLATLCLHVQVKLLKYSLKCKEWWLVFFISTNENTRAALIQSEKNIDQCGGR